MSLLTQHWAQRNFLSYCLLPFTFLYRIIISLRRFLYRCGLKKIQRFPVPVIIVGNITTGGTGKTPLVIWLANFLQQQGFKPGIVSRGYGGKADVYPRQVTAQDDPAVVGDEALLLVRNTSCPLIIDPKRVNAVKKLLRDTTCNIVISDDGLQHYALGRDLEIAVLDGQRRLGNNWCLPAGPLREPPSRLKEVDFIVTNGDANPGEYSLQLTATAFHKVTQPEITCDAENLPYDFSYAVAGIGNPTRFFITLQKLGLSFSEKSFPDHHPYTAADFKFATGQKNVGIIMTEKDAVKCVNFADERFWYLAVQAQLSNDFSVRLLEKLLAINLLTQGHR